MRSVSRLCVLALVSFSFVGCASYFKRKECESKNWYQYGYDLAMKGQRINNDNFVGECRKAEAEISEAQLDQGFKAGMSNYCKPEVVFQTGKRGESFNADLCDPGQARVLQSRHAEGIKGYCDPKNGFELGRAGNVYSKLCPPNLEKAFIPEYNRGRKIFLTAKVNETNGRVQELNGRINEKDRDLRNAQMLLAMVPPPQEVINRTVTANGVVETKSTNDPYADKRTELQAQVRNQESNLKELQSQQSSLRDEMFKYQRELQTID